MKEKIGIISDTHGLLRPEVLEILKDCKYILHAGDVNKDEILNVLRSMGNLYVVRGNNDKDWAENLRISLNFTIMVIGGSLGAASVNDNVRKILPELLKDFQVVHLCGKGKTDESLKGTTGYVQYEYIQDELPDLFAMADVVISRAGANAICEIRELHKPNLLIPLSAKASRGDQILNARSFERQGFSMVLEEEEITETKLLDTIHQLYTDRQKYTEAMAGNGRVDSISKITELIEECARS